jgi:hypothetical protein
MIESIRSNEPIRELRSVVGDDGIRRRFENRLVALIPV